LRVSPFHLNRQSWDQIEAAVRSFEPTWLHGYPSAIQRFADLWRGKLPRVSGVLAASETLPTALWDELEERWGAPVVSWYGHTEKQALGGSCPGNRAYHMFPTYGFVEVLDEQGPVSQGESGRLVATGFVSAALKVVRYDTGDAARFVGWGCDACGLEWPLIADVAGRWTHAPLIGRSGMPVTMTALNFHTPELSSVRRLRYVQEEAGHAKLLLETDALDEPSRHAIGHALREKLGDELAVELVRVDEIPVTPSGKHVLVDQRLPGP